MYPNSEQDQLMQLAEVYKGNPTGNPTQAPAAPQLEKGMSGQMMDMAKQRAMTGALDKGQGALMSGFGQSAAPVVASGVEGGAMLGPMAGSGAMAGMATAMPYVGAGILAGKALGLFSHGGHIGPLSPQYNAEGTVDMPTPMPRPLLGDMNELQGPMVNPWEGSKVTPAIDGGMPVQPMPMPMPKPRQIDMDIETLRNEYIKSLGE